MDKKQEIDDNIQFEVLPEDHNGYDLSFKVIIIGDSGVGKSCLTVKATKNIFESSYSATVGFEFFTFNIKLNDKVVKLQIWDTCGQEIYRSLITNFYRNSSLACMVYSIDSMDSFENVDTWLKEIKTHSNPDVKIFLIGNKADLEENRKVNKEVALQYQQENNIDYFAETSAKTGMNAQSVFVDAAKILYKDYLKYKDKLDERSRSGSVNSKGSMNYNSLKNANMRLSRSKSLEKQQEKKKGCC